MDLAEYTINEEESLLVALCKIDANKKGFLVVVDEGFRAVGTITDGDIRRAFILGKEKSDCIRGTYTDSFRCMHVGEDVADAIEIFKDEAIKFLPIIDTNNKMINIITKKQLHAVLLQDLQVDFKFDFKSLDESIIDHEIFRRPWGFYKTTVMNEYFQSKIICVNPKERLSLQSHSHREEHWIVAHGRGTVQLEESILEVHAGSSIFIPKGTKHRLTNVDEQETLIITEVQIGDYFGEDDIHRYEDCYGRV